MHTPTKAQWQTVIDNFKRVLPMATQPDHLNLMEAGVNVNHVCGTVHCIGGWYAIAACDLTQGLRWDQGAEVMAEHLGFAVRMDLKHWAGANPHIWGNKDGCAMFTMEEAWSGAKSLTDVITFLEAVRDRSPESPAKNQSYVP